VGAILSAVDKRMKTSVLMAGVAEIADILVRVDEPSMVEFRKSQPAGQLSHAASGSTRPPSQLLVLPILEMREGPAMAQSFMVQQLV
jgi:hypothetical protein